jgi:DNA adenine methylase
VSSLFRYPGGKSRLFSCIYQRVAPLLSSASTYVEPFVGGASIALAIAEQHPKLHLVLNDKDAGIAAMWRVVAGAAREREDLKRLIYNAVPSIRLREEFKARYGLPDEPVQLAFQTLFLTRTSFSGIIPGGRIGGAIDSRWRPARLCAEVDRAHVLLRDRCEVLCGDAVALLGSLGPRTATYADPPYVEKGDELYRERMALADHAALAGRLRGLSNWVLSYDDAPEVLALYGAWAQIERVETWYSVAKRRDARHELLILPPDHPAIASSTDAATTMAVAS